MNTDNEEPLDHGAIRDYYDRVYHNAAGAAPGISYHYRRLAHRFRPWRGKRLLDIGCGRGIWLKAAAELGASPVGIDISPVAVEACKRFVPQAELHCGPGERLPFAERQFDFVSCLGSLEHFLKPQLALQEIIRVSKPDAMVLLLVPNADFLTRRLKLYSGTEQVAVREDVRSLGAWHELFESVGLCIRRRWKDLHVLSASWVTRGPWLLWPVRLGQALALPFWPLSWQYQVYYLCRPKK